jgi:hypothetical protein
MENPDDGTERNHMENPDDCTERHHSYHVLHMCSQCILIFSPHRPQVRSEHQTGLSSGNVRVGRSRLSNRAE